MHDIPDEIGEGVTAGDQRTVTQPNADLHDTVINIARRGLPQQTRGTDGSRMCRFLILSKPGSDLALREAAPLHEPITQAVEIGDPYRAEADARHRVITHGLKTEHGLGHWLDPD